MYYIIRYTEGNLPSGKYEYEILFTVDPIKFIKVSSLDIDPKSGLKFGSEKIALDYVNKINELDHESLLIVTEDELGKYLGNTIWSNIHRESIDELSSYLNGSKKLTDKQLHRAISGYTMTSKYIDNDIFKGYGISAMIDRERDKWDTYFK